MTTDNIDEMTRDQINDANLTNMKEVVCFLDSLRESIQQEADLNGNETIHEDWAIALQNVIQTLADFE